MEILRVISGQARGLKLKTVEGNLTRPTSDRVKESLFNILTGKLLEADVLDLFAGTGSLGIEALSRGARSCVFVDISNEAKKVISDNIIHTKFEGVSEILSSDFTSAIRLLENKGKKFDLIFVDPPYNKNFIQDALKILASSGIIGRETVIIAERDINDVVPEKEKNLVLYDNRKYGDTVLCFYALDADKE